MPDHIDPEMRAMIDAKVEAGEVTRIPEKPAKPSQTRRRQRVLALHQSGATAADMAAELGVSTATIAGDRKALGLTSPRAKGSGDKMGKLREQRARNKVRKLTDRRRFQVSTPAVGKPAVLAPDDVCDEGRTMFPDRVFLPPGPQTECVLKDGSNNSKIGGDVLVGRLKGAYLATLTLQERATCPRSCKMWRGCYGNNMHHPRRWAAGPELESSLRIEVAEACEANELVLIRLHILGDFYSWEYVCLWAELLDTHEGLHVFGFTAWAPETKIGGAIARLRSVYPDRFMIRHSGTSGKWGSFTLPVRPDPEIDGGWPKEIGDAIVCPEQRDPYLKTPRARHCGNCAACWSTDRPIAFVEH